MRLSEIFVASVLFFGLFTTGAGFTNSLFEKQDVQDASSVGIQEDYNQLQNKIKGGNNSLQSKLNEISRPDSGALEKASAGLLLVPQFLDVLTTPFKILSSAVDGIAQSYAFIPAGFVTVLEILIIVSVGFAVLGLAIGQRV